MTPGIESSMMALPGQAITSLKPPHKPARRGGFAFERKHKMKFDKEDRAAVIGVGIFIIGIIAFGIAIERTPTEHRKLKPPTTEEIRAEKRRQVNIELNAIEACKNHRIGSPSWERCIKIIKEAQR